MKFIDVLFIIGIFLICLGSYAGFYLLKLSVNKTKEELKDLNIVNLWVLFSICIPFGLLMIFFWFD